MTFQYHIIIFLKKCSDKYFKEELGSLKMKCNLNQPLKYQQGIQSKSGIKEYCLL